LVKRVKELRNVRNEVVHGPWRLGQDVPEVIKLKGKGLEPDFVPYTVEKIRTIYEKVAALADDLTNFLIAYDMFGRLE
jgi:hypothetical protein